MECNSGIQEMGHRVANPEIGTNPRSVEYNPDIQELGQPLTFDQVYKESHLAKYAADVMALIKHEILLKIARNTKLEEAAAKAIHRRKICHVIVVICCWWR